MFVKPASKLIDGVLTEMKLRDPFHRDFVPSTGRLVDPSTQNFFRRRIADGDAVEITESQGTKPTASKKIKGSDAA